MKIDKNKIYALIGKIIIYSSMYVGLILITVWGFLQNTVY